MFPDNQDSVTSTISGLKVEIVEQRSSNLGKIERALKRNTEGGRHDFPLKAVIEKLAGFDDSALSLCRLQHSPPAVFFHAILFEGASPSAAALA